MDFNEVVHDSPSTSSSITVKQLQGTDLSFRGEMDEETGQGTLATGLDFLRHLQDAIRQTATASNASNPSNTGGSLNGNRDQGEDVNATNTSANGVAVSIYACVQVSDWILSFPYKLLGFP